jgi:hypothetical protein
MTIKIKYKGNCTTEVFKRCSTKGYFQPVDKRPLWVKVFKYIWSFA